MTKYQELQLVKFLANEANNIILESSELHVNDKLYKVEHNNEVVELFNADVIGYFEAIYSITT